MAPRRYFLLRCAEDRVIANAARTNTWPVSLGIVDRINKVFASGGAADWSVGRAEVDWGNISFGQHCILVPQCMCT